ncbi:MAG TPA: helix-hairpin-helix domain-containing protein [Polyangia bacterium]
MIPSHCRRALGVLVLAAALLAPRAGRAYEYSVEILVEDDDDVNQLYYDGEITEDERDRLLTLLLAKVDLNRATRDELYELPGFTWRIADAIIERRGKGGNIKTVDSIADIEGMTPEILAQARPFLTARSPEEERPYELVSKTGGIGRVNASDPAFYELLRARAYEHASAGVVVTARPMIGDIYGAAPGATLSAQAYETRPDLTHFYAAWDGPRIAALAGSYRVGYGLRLTLDNTRMSRPNGFIPNEGLYQNNLSGRLSPIDGFVGAIVKARYLPVARGWFELSTFGSWWDKDLYFTNVAYERGGGDPYIVDSDTGASIPYPTLRDVLRERIGGGNASYFLSRRIGVGVTGYYGDYKLNLDAPGVKMAVSSRYPEDRTTFGAVGFNARAGFGPVDSAAEVAVNDRGAPAVLAVAWYEPTARLQLIPSFRYYSPSYDNPYARGEADLDKYLGNMARDELGGRVRAIYKATRWLRVMAEANLWHGENPPYYDDNGQVVGTTGGGAKNNLKGLLRVDFRPTAKEVIAVWGAAHDKDLAHGGRGLSYADGSGMRWYYAVMARTTRLKRFTFAVMFKHIFEDTTAFTDRFDQTWYAWARVNLALRGTQIAARFQYYDQYIDPLPARTRNGRECDFEDAGFAGDPVPASCRGESYTSFFVQARQRLWSGAAAKLRVEWQHFTDDRAKWRPLDVPGPPRDEVLIKGYFVAQF